MNNYILKNCPNLTYCTSCNEDECGLCLSGDNYKRKCADNPNCLMKQIAEKFLKIKIVAQRLRTKTSYHSEEEVNADIDTILGLCEVDNEHST